MSQNNITRLVEMLRTNADDIFLVVDSGQVDFGYAMIDVADALGAANNKLVKLETLAQKWTNNGADENYGRDVLNIIMNTESNI